MNKVKYRRKNNLDEKNLRSFLVPNPVTSINVNTDNHHISKQTISQYSRECKSKYSNIKSYKTKNESLANNNSIESSNNSLFDYQERYWRLLHENAIHAIDELYIQCEVDENISKCHEIVEFFRSSIEDFENLVDKINIEKDYNLNQPSSVAWAVRKRKVNSPGVTAIKAMISPSNHGPSSQDISDNINKLPKPLFSPSNLHARLRADALPFVPTSVAVSSSKSVIGENHYIDDLTYEEFHLEKLDHIEHELDDAIPCETNEVEQLVISNIDKHSELLTDNSSQPLESDILTETGIVDLAIRNEPVSVNSDEVKSSKQINRQNNVDSNTKLTITIDKKLHSGGSTLSNKKSVSNSKSEVKNVVNTRNPMKSSTASNQTITKSNQVKQSDLSIKSTVTETSKLSRHKFMSGSSNNAVSTTAIDEEDDDQFVQYEVAVASEEVWKKTEEWIEAEAALEDACWDFMEKESNNSTTDVRKGSTAFSNMESPESSLQIETSVSDVEIEISPLLSTPSPPTLETSPPTTPTTCVTVSSETIDHSKYLNKSNSSTNSKSKLSSGSLSTLTSVQPNKAVVSSNISHNRRPSPSLTANTRKISSSDRLLAGMTSGMPSSNSLHVKLSSPDRKKSVSPLDLRKRHDAKLLSAEINRDRNVQEKRLKATKVLIRVKENNEREVRRLQQQEQVLVEKLNDAMKRHSDYIKIVKGKASNENTKVILLNTV